MLFFTVHLLCDVVTTTTHRYEVEHDGYCITVFSAPNYCDQMGNKGAFITFYGHDMTPHFTTYAAAPHPPVKAMAYATPMLNSMFGF